MNLSFFQFQFVYNAFLVLLKIFVWLILILWIKNSFDYFEVNSFISLFYDINKIEKNLPHAWEIIKEWFINTGWVLLKIISLQFIIYIFKRLPIFTKWLNFWDNNNEFSPIFGRLITEHLRCHSQINFSNFISLYKKSKLELKFIQKHNNNEQLSNFFKKYDANYSNNLSFDSKTKVN